MKKRLQKKNKVKGKVKTTEAQLSSVEINFFIRSNFRQEKKQCALGKLFSIHILKKVYVNPGVLMYKAKAREVVEEPVPA